MAEETLPKISGTKIIEMLMNLIRYDVPVLMLGQSSIGKSYTFIDLAERFRLQYELLYIGSEKAEHIEGLPRLTDLKPDQTKLEYMRPFWFPNEKEVNTLVEEGYKLYFEKYIPSLPESDQPKAKTYALLDGLLRGQKNVRGERVKGGILFLEFKQGQKEVQLEEQNYSEREIRALGTFLCTALGFGNYWLILDELDKIDPEVDKDKYAPLLHIVRERRLKDYRLTTINKGKGLDVVNIFADQKRRVPNDYSPLLDLIEMELNKPEADRNLLDTRIIGIANDTQEMDEALFRRFCQVVIDDILILDKQKIKPIWNKIRSCINEKLGGTEEMLEKGGYALDPKKIEDVNLQWQFNFLPKIINDLDEGNEFVEDFISAFDQFLDNSDRSDMEELPVDASNHPPAIFVQTMLFKLIFDNYELDTALPLHKCMADLIIASDQDVTYSSTPMAQAIDLYQNTLDQMSDASSSEIADEILSSLEARYGNIKLLKKAQNKDADKLFEFTDITTSLMEVMLLDDDGSPKSKPDSVAAYFIPLAQKMIISKAANDNAIAVDDSKAMVQKLNDFWLRLTQKNNLTEDRKNISFNPDAVHQSLYGMTQEQLANANEDQMKKSASDSLFGAVSKVNPEETKTSIYKNSISYRLMLKQMRDGFAVRSGRTYSRAIKKLQDTESKTEAGKELAKFFGQKGLINYMETDQDFKKEVMEYLDSLNSRQKKNVLAIMKQASK